MLTTHHQTKTALGTSIILLLVTNASEARTAELFRQLWLKVFWFEKRFSHFLPDSELCQFNRSAGTRQFVSPEFHDVLAAARDMAALTGGLFNPFILPALQRAGYKNSLLSQYAADTADDYRDRSVVGIDALQLGDDWAEIPYGTALHFGGCGKGYVGDLLAAVMRQFPEVQGYWFSVGGDIVAYGTDDQRVPWTVHIASAKKGRQYAADLVMSQQEAGAGSVVAVATSSVAVRKGVTDGKAWHHIIDPRSMRPADTDVVSSSVRAASLTEADVLASCVIIMGSKAAPDYIRDHSRTVTDVLLQCKTSSGHWRQTSIGNRFGSVDR